MNDGPPKSEFLRAKAEQQIEAMLYALLPTLLHGTDAVLIEAECDRSSGATTFHIQVSEKASLGMLIGKQGKTAQALRTLVAACGRKYGQRFLLEFDADPEA